MSNFQDWSVGSALESTYGTAVTVSRHYEFTDPKPFQIDRGIKQGAGIRVGSRVPRSARRVTTTKSASGPVALELYSRGLGLWLAAAMGSGTSTLVSTGVYQRVYTFADDLPAHTIQFGMPNASGTVNPITYKGCVVSSFEIGGTVGDIATFTPTWNARDWDTSTSYVTPSYAASPGNLFTVEDATIYSGTLTAPTSTALASGTTAVAGVSSFKVSVDNKLAVRTFANGAGLQSKPLPGTRDVSIELTQEYQDNTLRDAFLADSELFLLITLTGGALTSGNETFQVVVPGLKLDGDLPEGGTDAPATQPIKATVLDNLTAAQPLWLVDRTADTAL